jgi:hypothetical protein
LCRAAARVRRRNQRHRKAERVTGAAKIGVPAEGSRGFDDRQRVTMKIGTVNKESRAKSARHRRVLKMQSLGSGISPIAMDLVVSFEMQSLGSGSEASSLAKGILYRKALRTVSNRYRRACADCFRSRLRRLGFASPPRARPLSGRSQITTPSPRARPKPELSTLP